ncbi:MAG: RidA family protein [Acidimicrobiales bacterium]
MSAPVGPYSPAVRTGEWVVTSGQIGLAPGERDAPSLVEGGTGPELRQALANLTTVLAAHGATMTDVAKATVFLVDMSDYVLVNEIWTEMLPVPRPARTVVAVAGLPLGARVEVEAWARPPAPF